MGCGASQGGRYVEVRSGLPYDSEKASASQSHHSFLWRETTTTNSTPSGETSERFKPRMQKCMTRHVTPEPKDLSSIVTKSMELNASGSIEYLDEDGTPAGSMEQNLVGMSPRDCIHRPDRIVLIRHGESEANVDRKITSQVPDHAIHLTARGRLQATQAGEMLRDIVGDDPVAFIVSPYVRTRETFHGIARSFGPAEDLNVRLDVQIREQDHGNFDRPEMREFHKEKGEFGQFYYRFPEGESMADVYDRASIFLESLYRRWEFSRERNLVIVAHGLFILVFLMRLFRYSLDELYSLEPIDNCEMVVMEHPTNVKFYDISYTWRPWKEKEHGGLRKKSAEGTKQPQQGQPVDVWNGDPDAPMLVSTPKRDRLPRLGVVASRSLKSAGVFFKKRGSTESGSPTITPTGEFTEHPSINLAKHESLPHHIFRLQSNAGRCRRTMPVDDPPTPSTPPTFRS